MCRHRIQVIGLRLRLVLDIPVYRGRCTNERCRTYFTFLPAFAAPAKWYGYAQIEEAFTLLASRETTLTSAMDRWQADRENRIESGEPAGPSVSTLRRWWHELSEASTSRVWLEPAGIQIRDQSAEVLPDSSVRSVPERTFEPIDSDSYAPSHTPTGPEAFFFLLLQLAVSLFPASAPASISYLGLGIWTLEGQVGRRFLARPTLVGRVIPGPSPYMAEPNRLLLIYDPEPP